LARYFVLHDVTVIPHGSGEVREVAGAGMRTVLLVPRDGVPVVGVLGAIGPVKGARRLERLVARTRERGLRLRWVLVGYLDRQYQAYQDHDATFTVHGPYRRADVPALLDHYGIDLVVFPSAGPETFSFTLSEAWAAGRPALVPPIGALGERMSKQLGGWLMEDWTSDDRILDQLVELLGPSNAHARSEARARALAAANGGANEMAAATASVYRACLQPAENNQFARLPAQRLVEALRAAHGRTAARQETTQRFTDRMLIRLAHLGLRFRYTFPGKLLYRIVPQSLQRNLKHRLLT
jgi:glycosyltransferase involved in cell wall biosynthesis